MMKYGLDRFEGDIAVLVDGDGHTVSVKRIDLPDEAYEGDILLFDGEKYHFDPDTTAKKRAEVKNLIDELFN